MTVIKTADIYVSSKSLRSGDITQTEGPIATVTDKVGVYISEPSTGTQQQFMSAGKYRHGKETIERRLLYPDVPRNLTQISPQIT